MLFCRRKGILERLADITSSLEREIDQAGSRQGLVSRQTDRRAGGHAVRH